MHRIAFALSLLALAACHESVPVLDPADGAGIDGGGTDAAGGDTGGLDAGDRDSGGFDASARDADPTGERYWTLERTQITLRADACEVWPSGALALDGEVEMYPGCIEAGPVETVVNRATHTVMVRAFLWVHQGACTDVLVDPFQVPRTAVVTGLEPGDWTVVTDPPSATLSFRVNGEPPPITCTSPGPIGTACLADCDCEPGPTSLVHCVGLHGDALCDSRCARSCSPDAAHVAGGPSRDCPSQWSCEPGDYGFTCESRSANACTGDDACPAGMECATDTGDAWNECEWRAELNGTTRHACRDDADCEEPGLECVEIPGGERRCNVRCLTAEMRCPGPHVCTGGIETPGAYVCAWIGD